MKLSKDDNQVIDRAKSLIKEYGENAKTLSGDQLLGINDRLAVCYAYLSEIESERNREYAMSYRNRLMVKSSVIAMAISEGNAVTKAQTESDNDPEVAQARFTEITDSYLAETVQNLLKSIDRIIRACGYRLQYLYREQKNLETNHK